jgi:pimeloyl-ACP methyl ester carboxylesterase
MNSPIVSTLDTIVGEGTPVVSVSPIRLLAPGRALPLEVRVSAPPTGANLPIVLFSHGNGWSLDGYAPLVAFWASRGFMVIQPTHLDSRRAGIAMNDGRFPTIWAERIADLTRILDQLDTIEEAIPGLASCVDRSKIGAVGHSWGGHTVQTLLGARIIDAHGHVGVDMSDKRITVGMLLSATGIGGDDLHPFARENFPFMNPSFAELTTPTLVVAGDHDQSPMSNRGPDWFTDPYQLSPGATDLVTFFGAEHALGGIAGYDVAETTDENPDRVAVLQRLSTAYLRSTFSPTDDGWARARSALNQSADPIGRVDTR